MTHGIEAVGLVLHFRTPERTLGCLASLCAEGVRRTVVVDNSQDGGYSVAAMASGLAELRARGMAVELLQPARNLGFASGVNLGLTHILASGGGHVLLINSDAVLVAGALGRLVAKLGDAGVVAPFVRDADETEPRSLIAYYQRWSALCFRRSRFDTVPHQSGCCLLIRSDRIRADLFDRGFFFYGEDVMLGRTLQRSDVTVAECEDAIVIHVGSASARNGSLFYEYHMVRAHWLLARKLADNGGERLCFVLTRCFTLPMRAAVRSIRWRSMRPWRGLWLATLDVISGRYRDLTPAASRDPSR